MTCSEAIRQSAVLGSASASGREALAAFGCLKKYGRGEHIFRDKEEASALYFLVEGMASLYKINSLGEKKVIFAYGPGNLLNEEMLQNLPASVSCEAKENSLVFMIPRERLWTVMERDPALTRAVVQSMALKIRRLYRQMKNTTNALKGEKRLAAKLYMLARDYGKGYADRHELEHHLSGGYAGLQAGDCITAGEKTDRASADFYGKEPCQHPGYGKTSRIF